MREGVGADRTRTGLVDDPRRLERARVVALWNGGSASCVVPADGKVVIGRSTQADLRVDAPAVSREHAAIWGGSVIQIEDLGSYNGTWLDGRKLGTNERCALGARSVVRLGDALLVLQSAAVPQALVAEAGRGNAESAMDRLARLVELVSTSELPVILHGETGVGKEVTAERIHVKSRRSHASYLKINCAALPDAMVESELFGHERGAFTGAMQAKAGLLEAARGGTVLLDEVTELSLAAQAKLLRALDNREVIRVGATRPMSIDVRFLAATNGDFAALIAAGKFRADLYFRLNGITLEIPPLRERPYEMLSLARTFAASAAGRLGEDPPDIEAAAQSFMLGYSWPGNVRELKNVIERATLLAQGGLIRLEHLQPEAMSATAGARPSSPIASSPSTPPPSSSNGRSRAGSELWEELREHERERIVEAMAVAAGNQTQAARALGISRRALITRLENFKLPRPRKGNG